MRESQRVAPASGGKSAADKEPKEPEEVELSKIEENGEHVAPDSGENQEEGKE